MEDEPPNHRTKASGLGLKKPVISGQILVSLFNNAMAKTPALGLIYLLSAPWRSRPLSIMRLYWPKDEAVEGKWTAPPLKPVE
jgi:hypothetical protein